ncbi:TonB-dependent receptor [Marinomonas transparens]|uniref:TonB-dependent siderophore receptor n=1 Tax=Marinomonas transparens TaxID=2795388 RepID=A0A934JTE1_9GAMM|nr:TonB-dependent siderophore receptor [Marinomonas transparens]MBJ7539583.1 TonB-dependent siderophore receptor [Marinomonas transparens]
MQQGFNTSSLEVKDSLSRRHPMMLTGIALAVSAALAGQVNAAEETKLDTLVIDGSELASDANPYSEVGAPYKAKKMSDAKYTRDIAETPKTMTVLTKDSIEESGKTDLESILSAQPGITLGTGEGGNSFGDRYIIRGYEARSDVYTDGLREPGLISRETFALEQVEISKGPSSTFGGRGTTGGAVNSVTKKPSYDEDFSIVSGTLGTDNKQRYTLDTNKAINDEVAVRFNALYSEADIPDRVEDAVQHEGFLLSGVYEPNADVTINADYYYFRADDKQDVGYSMSNSTGVVRKSQYVGQKGLDFDKSEADIATIKINAYLADNLRVENKLRYGETKNDYIISAVQGASSFTAFNGWQENEYVGNQTNFIWDTNLFGKRNTIVTGVEYANEKTRTQDGRNATGAYFVTGLPITVDPLNADNNVWQGTVTRNNEAKNKLKLKTLSVYFMDTVTLSDDWEVHGGIRYDHFDYDADAILRDENNDRTLQNVKFNDGLWNGHFGAVFSPWEHGNVYATWSTSSNINGGEADSLSGCGYGGICGDANRTNYDKAEPEQTTNIELGTKWNLMDHKLLLTAAAFQITKDKVIEGGADSYSSAGSLNSGKNRVQGVEFGLSGNLTDKLSGQAGLALMKSKTLKSFEAENVGKPKANFADQSFNAQIKYQFTPKFAFGAVATYSSEIIGGQPDEGTDSDHKVRAPSYTVYDAFATYQVNKKLDIQANIQNLADKEYYTAIYRRGNFVYLGEGRSASVTAKYKF